MPTDSTSAAIDFGNETSFTLDFENLHHDGSSQDRLSQVTDRVLTFLDERQISATVFVVGDVAESVPSLVRAFADHGHEIGLHGLHHVALSELDSRSLLEQTRHAKQLVEDIAGSEVAGYRAPIFSIVSSTVWAADVLSEAGLRYSSSVLPARNPLFGFEGAPKHPFVWPSGLVELPCPLARLPVATFPVLGGTYLRLLPARVVAYLARRISPGVLRWTYCHPYDFDSDEPYARIDGLHPIVNRLLWVNRKRMFDKLDIVLAGAAAPPLRERLQSVRAGSLPEFCPAA